jgi:hypothetical protein
MAALALAAAGALLPTRAAVAQSIPPGLGVADRPRPGFDPLGIAVGSFRLLPNLPTDLQATDNFRASNSDRQGDVYLVAAPTARLASNWSRHTLNAAAYYSRSFHARLTQENVSQYGVSANGAYDLSRDGQISFDLSFDHKTEARSSLGSFQGTPSPVSYNSYQADLRLAQTIDRLVISVGAGAASIAFNDAIADDGTIIDQQFRNVKTISGNASAQLEIRGGVSLLVSGQFDKRSYPAPMTADQLNRDSTGYTLLAGVSLELSRLVFGQVQVGIINRSYDDALLKDVTGPSFRANLLWNVTPLTSLRLSGARTVEDAASVRFAGNTRSEVSLAVDHELYRYIILSADTDFSRFSANGDGAKGSEFSFGGGARYLFARRWSVNGRLRYSQRTSNDPRLRFHATTATISAQLAF